MLGLSACDICQVTEEDKDAMRKLFHTLDSDESNTIDRRDLRKMLKQVGYEHTKEEVCSLLSGVAIEDPEHITEEEFVELLSFRKQKIDVDNCIWAAFKSFDVDNDNHISLAELQIVLGAAQGEGMSRACIAAIIADYDEDGDYKLSFEEFKKLMMEED